MPWYPRPPRNPFWSEQCPTRQPGLTHTQNGTPTDPCKDCGAAPEQKPDEQDEQTLVLADHLFVPTMGNRCATCQRTRDAHPAVIQAAPLYRDDGSCNVDHASISTALLIGDGGQEWRRCPVCTVLVEPKLATGVVTGNEYDPGRGDPTPRLLKRLQAWVGWVDFQGKGR